MFHCCTRAAPLHCPQLLQCGLGWVSWKKAKVIFKFSIIMISNREKKPSYISKKICTRLRNYHRSVKNAAEFEDIFPQLDSCLLDLFLQKRCRNKYYIAYKVLVYSNWFVFGEITSLSQPLLFKPMLLWLAEKCRKELIA